MTRLAALGLIAGTLLAGVAMAGASRPAALSETAPGLWEVDGLPGAKTAPRECIGDVGVLARFEHRSRNCTQKVVRDSAPTSVIEYSCGSGDFGRSDVKVITPRSLRIETQGISGGLPFKYVLQARRVGDCPAAVSASRH